MVDCPGFSDSSYNKELPNRAIVHTIMKNAKSLTIALVINYNELDAKRG